MIFVKWMTEKSGFSYNGDGLPNLRRMIQNSDLYSRIQKAILLMYRMNRLSKEKKIFLMHFKRRLNININNGGNKVAGDYRTRGKQG